MTTAALTPIAPPIAASPTSPVIPPLSTYSTGTPQLDLVLGGGFPAASTTIVAGLPGTGKTILAEQFLFTNATPQAPALYLTSLSEPLEKLVRYVQQFSFFDRDRLRAAIHYQDIGEAISRDGIASLPVLVETLLVERAAAFLVVDSFKALHDLSGDTNAFRTALFDLGRVLASTGVTALLVGEYSPEEIAALPEFAVADGVVELTNRAHGMRYERTVRVHKLRGAATLPGEHSFRIGPDGLLVYPRLTGAGDPERVASDTRVSTGVTPLDAMLEGGPFEGTATLVAGPTGVGKTTLGLQFLAEGARCGEPGLLVQFQESPSQVVRLFRNLGVDAVALAGDGLITTLHVTPLEINLVELLGEIRALVQRHHVRRIVVDALGDMQDAAIERDRFRAAVWTLMRFLGGSAVTGLFLAETPFRSDETARSSVTQGDVSYMADNLLLLRHQRPPRDGYDRTVEVLKSRGSPHDSAERPFLIDSTGWVVSASRAAPAVSSDAPAGSVAA